MAVYTDTTGRTWTVNVTVKSLKNIRNTVKDTHGESFDLLAVKAGSIARVLSDPVLLTDILWALNAPQARAEGVSEEAFYNAHRGNVIIEAQDALADAIASFFPDLEGLAYRQTFQTVRAERARAVVNMEEKLKEIQNGKETQPETEKTRKKTRNGSGN